jgi:hypothetical protein
MKLRRTMTVTTTSVKGNVLFDPFDGTDPLFWPRGEELPLKVNPEPVPAFKTDSRWVDH